MKHRTFILAVLGAGLAGMGLVQAADTRLGDSWGGLYLGGNLGYGFAHSAHKIINSSCLKVRNPG